MMLGKNLGSTNTKTMVYVIQDIPGTKIGTPKINIIRRKRIWGIKRFY